MLLSAVHGKIAVILTTLNGGEWLEEQLSSVAAQTGVDLHMFIRDDGSVDNTADVVRTFMKAHPNVEWVDPVEGAAGSAAGNFFLALRRVDLNEFDYVSFSDQDDIWSPGKLARAIECLQRTGAGGYSSDLVAFDNGKRRAWYLEKSGQQRRFDYLFQGASAGSTYVLTRRAAQLVLERTQGLTGNDFRPRSHDWLIYAICRSHGLGWYMDRAAFIFYRQHARNAFGALPALGGLRTRLQLARSGWYRSHVIWLHQFVSATPEESRVFRAVTGMSVKDRLWLVLNVGDFRRSVRDRVLLMLVILSGLF